MIAKSDTLTFSCAVCNGSLDETGSASTCPGCGTCYPTVAGIRDFRVTADPWISIADDREKALRLARETTELGFEDTVRAYWNMTPSTPKQRADNFVAHVINAETRSREWLASIADDIGMRGGLWLDLGCGTGDLMAAAPPGVEMLGVDIALRWLVAASKRPGVAGTDRLICADAAHLPLESGSVDVVLSLGLLEHCENAARVVGEAARVLRPGGKLVLRTSNRFTLMSEPHVGVWGVGWLPRGWADSYVRRVSGQRYLHHRPLSSRQLRTLLQQGGFGHVCVRAPELLPAEATRLGNNARRIAPVYRTIRKGTWGMRALTPVAPLLEAVGTRL